MRRVPGGWKERKGPAVKNEPGMVAGQPQRGPQNSLSPLMPLEISHELWLRAQNPLAHLGICCDPALQPPVTQHCPLLQVNVEVCRRGRGALLQPLVT